MTTATKADLPHLMRLAREAQAAWGCDGEPKLLSHRENAVFRAMQNGQPVALRLHRPGYMSEAEILSEIWWTRQLADAGFNVPRPLTMLSGEDMLPVGDRLATAISWVEGTPLADLGEDRSRDLGAALARLHDLTDAATLPDWFTRHRWDIDGLVGDAPNWGRFWDHPALDQGGKDQLRTARDAARSDLETHRAAGGDFGLIHADALGENVFATDYGLCLIDFDDSGFGYRMYDLAVAASQSFGAPDYASKRDALAEGYASLRPLPGNWRDLFALFAFLRAASSLGWTEPRMDPGAPRMAHYRDRALAAARDYLAGSEP